jgi:GcrA cell cycle regulator
MTTLVHAGDLETPPRLREVLRRRRRRAAVTTEFGAVLDALGLAQHRVAQLFDVTPRSVRRWRSGDRPVPCGVSIVLRLLAAGAVTVAQVEQAAILAPARTNGGKGKPSAPLRVEPAPKQSALACVADPGSTTAEKILALGPSSCRWPHNDPRHSDFRFCGAVTEKGPYCARHARLAYLAPRTSSGHGARIRLVAQWGHQASRPKGTHHAAAPVALFVPPAGTPNR